MATDSPKALAMSLIVVLGDVIPDTSMGWCYYVASFLMGRANRSPAYAKVTDIFEARLVWR